jgi:hypothetical protein
MDPEDGYDPGMIETKDARRRPPKTGRAKMCAWMGGGGLAILIVCLLSWKHHFHDYTPLDALKDLRAGAQAGHSPHPAREFLELRYGPQTDPANREKALEDFFNVGHIEGLYLIVGNRTDAKTKKLVGEVAGIIGEYRQTMSATEKADLGAYFNSDAGRAQIHAATDDYQSKSSQYRSITSPVVGELLTTLTAVKPSSP